MLLPALRCCAIKWEKCEPLVAMIRKYFECGESTCTVAHERNNMLMTKKIVFNPMGNSRAAAAGEVCVWLLSLSSNMYFESLIE